jgi:hypothetical protein
MLLTESKFGIRDVNKTQKGRPFLVAALLETGFLSQDGQVTSRAP